MQVKEKSTDMQEENGSVNLREKGFSL